MNNVYWKWEQSALLRGNKEMERAAFALGALCPYTAASYCIIIMFLDDVATKYQAKARSIALLTCLANFFVGAEQVLKFLTTHANPGIGHAKMEKPIVVVPRLHSHYHRTRRGVLNGVVYKISKHDFQQLTVASGHTIAFYKP